MPKQATVTDWALDADGQMRCLVTIHDEAGKYVGSGYCIAAGDADEKARLAAQNAEVDRIIKSPPPQTSPAEGAEAPRTRTFIPGEAPGPSDPGGEPV